MKRRIETAVIDSIDGMDKKGLIDIYWDGELGFGHIYLIFNNDDQLVIESEYMGKEFIKEVLCKLVDDACIKT